VDSGLGIGHQQDRGDRPLRRPRRDDPSVVFAALVPAT
jgi:hypothetical protein